jgi:hypothetical protein
MSTMKLHTAKHRKFVQVLVTGLSNQLLRLTEPQLTSGTSVDLHFKSLNPNAGQKLVIGNGMSVSFMWEVEIGNYDDRSTIPIKTNFRIKYIAIKNIEDINETDNVTVWQIIIALLLFINLITFVNFLFLITFNF